MKVNSSLVHYYYNTNNNLSERVMKINVGNIVCMMHVGDTSEEFLSRAFPHADDTSSELNKLCLVEIMNVGNTPQLLK